MTSTESFVKRPPVQLSPDEQQLLRHLAEDKTTQEIAVAVSRSPRTIEGMRNRIKEKLEVNTIAGLMAKVMRLQLISLPD